MKDDMQKDEGNFQKNTKMNIDNNTEEILNHVNLNLFKDEEIQTLREKTFGKRILL